jgi:hypothetical protein
LFMKLKLRRWFQPPPPLEAEGCPRWEWSYVREMAFYRQYCIERRRPRNYTKRGLEKLNVAQPGIPIAVVQSAPTVRPEHLQA